MMETLEERYKRLVATKSDINEHLPLLRKLASRCDHITELGTRFGVSTTAFLAAQPTTLVTVDVREQGAEKTIASIAGRTDLRFVIGDSLAVDLEPTDLLFVDTIHTFEQVEGELDRHWPLVRKWIVFHDTSLAGAGVWQAVEHFLEYNTAFVLVTRRINCNGLTVLRRIR